MSAGSRNRDIESLFEEVMPGYRCTVTRQPEGAINLQFQRLSNQKTITLPAVDPSLWDSPEKLQKICEQIDDEFLLFCEETPPFQAERAAAPIQVTETLAEKLYAIVDSLGRQKESR